MPVILDSEEEIKQWLNTDAAWSAELEALMRPYDKQLEV